jgi:hypothetical protein
MLKFQFTQSNNSYDTKTLEIADVERKEGVVYDISGNDYDTISELDNEVQYSISVKNLYGIQNGSYINYVGNVTVGTDDDGTKTSYRYVKELIVDSVSSIENSFNVNVEKELPLYVENVRIESTYHTISFNNNRWEVNLSSKEMVDEAKRRLERSKLNLKNDDNYPIYNEINEININQFAFGENGITEGVETEYDKIDNTVFYYENDSWKTIDLVGNDLEECLINGQFISLESIHEYDKRVCEAIKLDRNNLYYMHENYVVIELSSTHYFIDPQIEYDIIELEYKGGYTMPKMTAYGRNVIKKINYPYVYMYIESLQKENSSLNEIKIEKECHIDGNEKLIFNYDIFKEIVDDGETEDNEYPKVIETDETKRYLTEDEFKLFEQYLFPYGYSVDDNGDAEATRGSSGAIKIKRENFMFDTTYSSFSLAYDTAINVAQIPISQKFENDLFHNDMVQTHFVEAEKNKSINPIIDMEKDMYTPAIQEANGSQINADYEDCYKIIFNLHFREHRDVTNTDGTKEEWKCDRDSYWNGTRVITQKKGTIVDLRGRVYNYPINGSGKTESAKKDYFSYFGTVPENTTPKVDDENDVYGYDGENDYDTSNTKRYCELRGKRNALTEYQSDLLSYLGFVNNDVKYQKSKLTKSFLRLSFYDSDNIGNQNLLQTSTIFLDGGELFAKYIKYINTEEEYIASNKDIYTKTEYDLLTDDEKSNLGFTNNGEPTANIGDSTVSGDKNTSYNNSGVRVSREPMRKSIIDIEKGDLGDNIDELERLRLSSQIVITDKYSSKHSSEGFYFYTYKTNNNGVYPSDIYMRVDFCHAGYGRTLPFMMPYIRNNEQENIGRYADRSNKIKTFDDIAYDWSAVDIDKDGMPLKDDSDVGYDPIKYMKYCYIKLKYRYDKKTQKHIYYLDPDVYGDGVTSNNGHGHNIILNLYEAKIK